MRSLASVLTIDKRGPSKRKERSWEATEISRQKMVVGTRMSGGAVKLKVELMEFTDVSVRGVQNDPLEKCGVTAG